MFYGTFKLVKFGDFWGLLYADHVKYRVSQMESHKSKQLCFSNKNDIRTENNILNRSSNKMSLTWHENTRQAKSTSEFWKFKKPI